MDERHILAWQFGETLVYRGLATWPERRRDWSESYVIDSHHYLLVTCFVVSMSSVINLIPSLAAFSHYDRRITRYYDIFRITSDLSLARRDNHIIHLASDARGRP